MHSKVQVVPRLEAAGDLCDGSISAVAIEWHDAKRFPVRFALRFGEAVHTASLRVAPGS